MNNVKVKFQLDIPCDITMINEKTWEKIGKPELKKAKKRTQGITFSRWIVMQFGEKHELRFSC